MLRAPNPQACKGFIPNLINGISQQPSNIRFPSQADECVNHMPTIQEQLARRNPLEVLWELSSVSGLNTSSFIHWYRRDTNEAYVIFFTGSGIQVYSLIDGTQHTVHMMQPGGDNYHTSASALDNFYCYTYKDTTFVVNRGVTCAYTSDVSATRNPECLLKVLNCGTGFIYNYTVTIGAASHSHSITAVGTDTASTIAAAISADIQAWAVGNGGGASTTGNVVWVESTSPSTAVTLQVSDNQAGSALLGIITTVNATSNLPFYAPHNYVITVEGDVTDNNSQGANAAGRVVYQFAADGGVGTFTSGVWKESIAEGINYKLDPATMPHELIRNGDGTFTYQQIAWTNRLVGDTLTNPDPAFIGNYIQSCFLSSGRFGLLSYGSFILSKVDEPNYFDFFKTTITTQLDTDPISAPVPSSQVNRTYWATPWNGELMVFGGNLDAAVEWAGTMAQNTITVNTPTRFGINPLTPPILSGSSLIFNKTVGNNTLLYDYHLDPVTALKDADNLTSYCGNYIPANVIAQAGTEKDFVLMLTRADRTTLYAYNYSKLQFRLVQQAFHKWTFDPSITIYGMFIDSINNSGTLYILYSLAGNFFIGQILISVGALDPNYLSKSYMDSRITEAFPGVSVSYSSTTNRTTVTLPFSFGTTPQVIELRAAFTDWQNNKWPVGELLPINSQTSTSIVLVGNWTGAQFYVGLPFTSYYDVCKFHVRTPNPDGSGMVVDTFKEIQLKRLVLSYNNSGFYQIQVLDRVTGAVIAEEDMPIKLDNIQTVFDSYVLYGGFHLMAIRKPITNYKIRLLNTSTRPHYFTGVAWYGEYTDATM